MSDLPFEIEEERPAPEPETLASNILVVDDEPVVRDVFRRLLSREQDMVVSVAEDAEQGLELIKKGRFELLITDKNLPGMGGIELIAEARAVRPMIEAVMITGYASSESLISAFAAGASDYLVKPFDDLKVVRAKIRAALQRRLDRGRLQLSSKEVAQQAAAMLAQGKDAPESVWRKLDTKFAEYEHAIREGGSGDLVVVGTNRVVDTLSKARIPSRCVEANSPEVLVADVVVIETGAQIDWHPLAEKLIPLSPDVVLVAGPDADLSDLLEAISLRVDLVGFGGHTPARQLPDRIRANLMRRSVERAQRELVLALSEFKASLRARPEIAPTPSPLPGPEAGAAAAPDAGSELDSIEVTVDLPEPVPAPGRAAERRAPADGIPAVFAPPPARMDLPHAAPRSPTTPSAPLRASGVPLAARAEAPIHETRDTPSRTPTTPASAVPAYVPPVAPSGVQSASGRAITPAAGLHVQVGSAPLAQPRAGRALTPPAAVPALAGSIPPAGSRPAPPGGMRTPPQPAGAVAAPGGTRAPHPAAPPISGAHGAPPQNRPTDRGRPAVAAGASRTQGETAFPIRSMSVAATEALNLPREESRRAAEALGQSKPQDAAEPAPPKSKPPPGDTQ